MNFREEIFAADLSKKGERNFFTDSRKMCKLYLSFLTYLWTVQSTYPRNLFCKKKNLVIGQGG